MEEELDIKDFINALWQKKWIIIIITIIFFLFGMLKFGNIHKSESLISNSNLESSEEYIAETSFLLESEEKITRNYGNVLLDSGVTVPTDSTTVTKNRISIEDSSFSTYSDILMSKKILNQVIKDFELDTSITDLRKSIVLTRSKSSNLLKIYVKYSDKDLCLEIANCLAEHLAENIYEKFNVNTIVMDDAEILSKDEVKQLGDTLKTGKTSMVVVAPSSMKKVIVITALGFIAVCGVIVFLELFDNSIKNPEQLEKISNLKNLTILKNNKHDNQNDFKLLRVNINECKTILVTSPEKNTGKSYVALNLAKSFARLDKKVLLIDLTKNESELLKKYDGNGLTDYLDGQDKFVEKYAVESNVKNLSILLSGKKQENMTELLESSKMVEALSTAERLYDVIIIDSENVIESANTLAVAKIAKYSLLVCVNRKTKLANLVKAKNNIEDVGGNVVGTVLNSTK